MKSYIVHGDRLNKYFARELELLLTPIKLDPAHPFPYLPSHVSRRVATHIRLALVQAGGVEFSATCILSLQSLSPALKFSS